MAENIAEALGMPPRKRAATQISPDKGVKRKRNREGQPQDNPGNSSSNEEDAGEKEKAFDHIFNTNLNHRSWDGENVRDTCLIYIVDKGEPKILSNEEGKHAEINLKEELLKDDMDMAVQRNIQVYINNSPCRACADELIVFLDMEKNSKVHMEIYAASLYNIKRKSCIDNGEPHVNSMDEKESEKESDSNAEGLRKLMEHPNCEMRVFKEKAWDDLMHILEIHQEDFNERYETTSEGNDRSRRNEDERLKEDLKDISQKKIISWHEYFMGVAFLSAKRSKDPNRQVGSCIINDERRIVATGYNGFVELDSDSDNDAYFPWTKPDKHRYVCHAEMNAVVNRHGTSLKGCTVYVTLFPCNECTKLLIQSGIVEVIYYADDKAAKEEFKASREMLELKGVKLREYKDLDGKYQGRRINLKFDDFAK